jgi:hypothetical protein
MTTPIQPPGSSAPLSGPNATEGPSAGSLEGRPGELRGLVDEARASGVGGARPENAQASGATASGAVDAASGAAPHLAAERVTSAHVAALHADLEAGRVDVEQALDRLVERALSLAAGLPMTQRAALEAQLRAALTDDPTLVALREDLQRVTDR